MINTLLSENEIAKERINHVCIAAKLPTSFIQNSANKKKKKKEN